MATTLNSMPTSLEVLVDQILALWHFNRVGGFDVVCDYVEAAAEGLCVEDTVPSAQGFKHRLLA